MTKQSFVVLIEKGEDGVFIGTVPSLKGCYSYGKTLDELMANLREAIGAHFEAFGEEATRYPIRGCSGDRSRSVDEVTARFQIKM